MSSKCTEPRWFCVSDHTLRQQENKIITMKEINKAIQINVLCEGKMAASKAGIGPVISKLKANTQYLPLTWWTFRTYILTYAISEWKYWLFLQVAHAEAIQIQGLLIILRCLGLQSLSPSLLSTASAIRGPRPAFPNLSPAAPRGVNALNKVSFVLFALLCFHLNVYFCFRRICLQYTRVSVTILCLRENLLIFMECIFRSLWNYFCRNSYRYVYTRLYTMY